jgi:hypothetical protein
MSMLNVVVLYGNVAEYAFVDKVNSISESIHNID